MPKKLYLGLEMPSHLDGKALHCPIIRIEERDPAECLNHFNACTHLILTSKSTVRFLQKQGLNLSNKVTITVGKQTASLVPNADYVAAEECAEGVVALLKELNLHDSHLFWPHAAQARTVISDYCRLTKLKLSECIIYDTLVKKPLPLPNLDNFEEIIFTSPSCVDAFCQLFGALPKGKQLTAIGPITQERLKACSLNFNSSECDKNQPQGV